MRFNLAVTIPTVLVLLTGSIEAPAYQYPYDDPYLATATTAILSEKAAATCVTSTIVHVPGLPGRNKMPTLEGRGNVSLALYHRKRPAPLLFIVAGLGSNPYFGVAPYLASLFYGEGFDVVILPSPMSWNFALAASRSGAPGYVPQDARDLYEVMIKTLTILRNQYDIKPTAIHFMGLSLGGLEGAYLSVIDDTDERIGIAKYLLVNPPIDLAYGIKKIDEWNTLARKFGREKSQEVVSRALAIVDSFFQKPDDPAVFDRFVKKFDDFTTEEIQFLVAENLQSQLPELVYVTQVIHDQKVLTAPKEEMRKRLEEAHRLTFTDYNRKIALPLWQKQAGGARPDLDTFIRRGSLARIIDRLRGNPKVHILHNADDFLAEPKSIEALKKALGEQVTVYPQGGHLGNVWFPENRRDALRFFRPRP